MSLSLLVNPPSRSFKKRRRSCGTSYSATHSTACGAGGTKLFPRCFYDGTTGNHALFHKYIQEPLKVLEGFDTQSKLRLVVGAFGPRRPRPVSGSLSALPPRCAQQRCTPPCLASRRTTPTSSQSSRRAGVLAPGPTIGAWICGLRPLPW